jgi:hypothetical protein
VYFFLRLIDERTGCAMVVSTIKMSLKLVWKEGAFLRPLQTRNIASAHTGSVWHLARAPRQDTEDTHPAQEAETIMVCVAIPGLRGLPRRRRWTGPGTVSSIYALKNWKLVVAETREREHPYWEL